jgi:hypothetical protein
MTNTAIAVSRPVDLPHAGTRVGRMLRRAAFGVAAIAVAAALAEVGIRLALGNAFMSPPVFQAATGTPAYTLLPSVSARVWQFGRGLQVSTDPSGHRLTPGAPASAPVTLHLVGDSQVFGWGLSDDETLSARLQKRLGSTVRVVNDGVPGYGPHDYRAVLETIPSSDLVVVVSTEENDGGDAYRLGKAANVSCGFISSFEQGGSLQCALVRSRLVQATFAKLTDFDHRYHMTPVGFSDVSLVAGRVISARITGLLGDEARRRTGRTLFTIVPWKGRYSESWRSRYAPPPVADSSTLPTPFPDSLDTVRRFASTAEPASLYFADDTHLNPAGASLLADVIAGGLELSSTPLSDKEHP